jgi:hypothetical protein
MSNKQTAIDWLYSQISFNGLDDPDGEVLKKAKQMEKEQIKDAFTDGCIGELYEINAYYTSEKYYNETYNQQENDN